MRKDRTIKKRWRRAHSFFTEVAQAGACEEWAGSHKKLADSTCESAFFIIEPEQSNGGEKMRRLNRKGQSVLEYVIILTAIVAAFILATTNIKDHIETSLSDATTYMETEVTTGLDFIQ